MFCPVKAETALGFVKYRLVAPSGSSSVSQEFRSEHANDPPPPDAEMVISVSVEVIVTLVPPTKLFSSYLFLYNLLKIPTPSPTFIMVLSYRSSI